MTVDLSVAQSVAFLVVSVLLVIILVRVLALVHHQSNRVKELEMRMKAMENLDASETVRIGNEKTEG